MRWLVLISILAGCPGPGGGSVPTPDTCSDLTPREPVDALEIGAGNGSELFVPWVDGDPVPIVVGPQGGSMIAMRMRLVAASPPDCVPQESAVLDTGQTVIASLVDPVKAYGQGDGSSVTRTMWLIFTADVEVGQSVTVEVTALEQTVTRALRLAGSL